jgi:uncharacterized membrane protein
MIRGWVIGMRRYLLGWVLICRLDDTLVPLHLLIWSLETAVSTLTCTVEAMSWEGFTSQERIALAQLYVPYLALGT